MSARTADRDAKLSSVIQRLVDEHGAPNRFATSELAVEARMSSSTVRRWGHTGPRDFMIENRRMRAAYRDGWFNVTVVEGPSLAPRNEADLAWALNNPDKVELQDPELTRRDGSEAHNDPSLREGDQT